MEIHLYHNAAEPTRVDKTLFLDDETRLYCTFDNKPQNVTAPVVLVHLDAFPTFNYAKITELSRYYFVSRVEILPDDLYRLYLDVDVLLSYADEIRNLSAVVARNENTFDDTIVDDRVEYKTTEGRIVKELNPPSTGLKFTKTGTSTTENFVFVSVGGSGI